MKLGYSKLAMQTVPVDTAIPYIATCGYDGIELDNDLDCTPESIKRISGLLKQYDLCLTAIGTWMEVADDSPSKAVQQVKKGVNLAMELAQGDKPPPVITALTHIFGFSSQNVEEWESKKAVFAEQIGELAAYAASRGVILAINPPIFPFSRATRATRPASLDLDKVFELLKLVNSPYLRVNFDTSDFAEIDSDEVLSRLMPVSVHAHVTDVFRLSGGSAPWMSANENVEHISQSAAYFKAMQVHGYNGFITATVCTLVHLRGDYDPLAAAKFAYQHLSPAFTEAGIVRANRA